MLTRRNALAMAAVGIPSAFGTLVLSQFFPESRAQCAQGPEDKGMVLIGRWYLSTHPEEADKSHLGFLLGPLADSDEFRGFAERGVVGNGVRGACTSDYARGDVLFVGGWQLTRTEARLCALAALA